MTRTTVTKAVVLLSGGLDSATASALARREGWELYGLTVRYGQVHACEIDAARRVAAALGFVKHAETDVDLKQFGGSSLVGEGEIPQAEVRSSEFEVRSSEFGVRSSEFEARTLPPSHTNPRTSNIELQTSSIPTTYVPARNTVLLALALAWAESLGASRIVIGVNALDYSGYPDCRPEFIAAFERLASVATKAGVEGESFQILAPLLHLSKAEIVTLGLSLGLDYSLTHSCYDPRPDGSPCGRCDSCRLRAAGFADAGLRDPLLR